MGNSFEEKWDIYVKKTFDVGEALKLRKGSQFKKALPWVAGKPTPSLPTKMLSNVSVYESWINPSNIQIAKGLVEGNRELSIRDLAHEMLSKSINDQTCMPYLWWIWPHSYKTRAIHEDAEGVTFVKLDGKWQMVFSVQTMGILAGAQGMEHYEQLPKNCYFVSWENEEIAKSYI